MDFERIFLLLSVIEKASAHGPAYSQLIAEAGKELKTMQDDLAVVAAEEKAKADAEAVAEKKAKVEAKAKPEARLNKGAAKAETDERRL